MVIQRFDFVGPCDSDSFASYLGQCGDVRGCESTGYAARGLDDSSPEARLKHGKERPKHV